MSQNDSRSVFKKHLSRCTCTWLIRKQSLTAMWCLLIQTPAIWSAKVVQMRHGDAFQGDLHPVRGIEQEPGFVVQQTLANLQQRSFLLVISLRTWLIFNWKGLKFSKKKSGWIGRLLICYGIFKSIITGFGSLYVLPPIVSRETYMNA